MHRQTLFVVGLCAHLLACGIEESESFIQGAIVNGTKHTGHPSVVPLRHGGKICTATLIGKKTAVTAAHCIDPQDKHYLVVDGLWHMLASYKRHESYTTAGYNNDIALVFLGAGLGIKPSPISTLPPDFGQTITMIGFGRTAEDTKDSGAKRLATTTLSSLTPNRLKYFKKGVGNICNGDSGGPSFATIQGQEVQVGVHSVKYGKCGDGGADIRVDVYKDWIVKHGKGDVVLGPTKLAPPPDPTPTPQPGDADGDGIPDAEDLCSNTPKGAKVWTSGEYKGCAGGQTKDPKPPPDPPPPPPDPGPDPQVPDADGDGIPDDEDHCDKTPAKWHQGVHQSGDYKGCYPNGDVITD